MPEKPTEEIESVAIRFTGDSGDGMQLTGTKFTESTALAGNDLATLPDYPAEIRAPTGTLAGVSGFQIHFSSHDIRTPADHPDVLVSFNPAALRANVEDVRPGGMVILNIDAFTEKALTRAGYTEDPLPALRDRFQLVEIPFTKLNRAALADLDLRSRDADRSKNFFALGMLYWLYNRPMEPTLRWLEGKFKGDVLEANARVLKAGHAFGETTETLPRSFVIPRAKIAPGHYRNITGNTALAWGIVAASQVFDQEVFLGAYPITPASEVLHEVSRYRHFGVKTFQAEDEIAAISSAIGASFAGSLGVCTTSGPGLVLKQEALGLAIMAELPLVVVNVQRAGPSTGMPTKVEQADLLNALYGRNSDSPVPVIAAATAGDCFGTTLEAFRLAVKYMTPVVMLSDSYLANSAEPWQIPDVASLGQERAPFATDPESFQPYSRDPETLARPWATPGTAGLEHRIGGLAKQDGTGNVSYDAKNNAHMHALRHEKVARIANEIPPTEVLGPDRGELLVVGWGSTQGAILSACIEAREDGQNVSNIHLRYLNPLPPDLGEVLARFDKVLVPELNLGQLSLLIRSQFLIDAKSLSKVEGQPFLVEELRAEIDAMLGLET
ncbi:MAG: 2-oxoacid:acceptor oxidoreductase subunit alpha [Deltaproteobacteria bacterium]|nr:2-oxoacid:acceptor oxidoreductase subunit alpha [Deltaproteobacteria bacterium]MBW2360354.1 2-oxoacid:acceptor oxidoreductase subunit alpha [Deltaproteobacteria bacterium]